MNKVQECAARSDTRQCASAERPVAAPIELTDVRNCIVPHAVHRGPCGDTCQLARNAYDLAQTSARHAEQQANELGRLLTLPPPPAVKRVTVTDPETGEVLDELDVEVGGYVLLTNGCKVAADRRHPQRGVHHLTLTGVALDAAVIR